MDEGPSPEYDVIHAKMLLVFLAMNSAYDSAYMSNTAGQQQTSFTHLSICRE
jgi:hypothetical protein